MKSSRSQFYTWIELGISAIWIFNIIQEFVISRSLTTHRSRIGSGEIGNNPLAEVLIWRYSLNRNRHAGCQYVHDEILCISESFYWAVKHGWAYLSLPAWHSIKLITCMCPYCILCFSTKVCPKQVQEVVKSSKQCVIDSY